MNMAHTGRIFVRSAAKSSEIFWMGKSVMEQVAKLVAISAAVRTEMQRHMLTLRQMTYNLNNLHEKKNCVIFKLVSAF